MDNKEKIILLELILLILLLLIAITITYREKSFKRDCIANYTGTELCPCPQTIFNSTSSLFADIPMSKYYQNNISKSINNNIS